HNLQPITHNPSGPMPFSINESYHAVVIEVRGKFLGSIDGSAFKETLGELKADGKTYVVVDLSDTEAMDSSASGALISGLTTMRREGGDVRLTGMEKRIKSTSLMTRLLVPVFDDYKTVEAALESYSTNPPAQDAV